MTSKKSAFVWKNKHKNKLKCFTDISPIKDIYREGHSFYLPETKEQRSMTDLSN